MQHDRIIDRAAAMSSTRVPSPYELQI